MSEPPADQPPPPSIPPWLKRLSAASVLLAIVGTVTHGIASAAGLILGAICWRKIRAAGGERKDADTAIMGTVFSALVIAAYLALPPIFARWRDEAQVPICEANLKEIGIAIALYQQDYDYRYPPADSWCDAIHPEYIRNELLFRCPAAMELKCGYAFNVYLDALKREDRSSDTVAVAFDGKGGWNAHGGPEAFDPRHQGKGLLIQADGQRVWRRAEEVNAMLWTP